MHRSARLLPPGCLALLLALLLLLPLFLAQLMAVALERLGLPPAFALAAVLGIFLGGMVNIPVKTIEREEDILVDPLSLYGFGKLSPFFGLRPRIVKARTRSVIAVNLGGCVIPVGIAVYETVRVIGLGWTPTLALAAVTVLNVLVCQRLARPVPQVGIAMPALVPPLVAAAPSLLLVPELAPPVAFVAGVLGPLVGADLFHLKEVTRVPTGVASIGGAGTFDGIVLSGMIATALVL